MPSPFNDLMDLLPQLPNALTDVSGDETVYDQVHKRLSVWQGHEPKLEQVHICLFAATHEHGEAVEAVRRKMNDIMHGRMEVNALCKEHGVGLRVLELALDHPSSSPSDAALYSDRETMAGIAFGMESAAAGGDLLCLGDMADGTEIGAKLIIEACHGSDQRTPLELLAFYGGREIAAMVGGIIAARAQGLPVLLDGWAALAAARVLHKLDARLINHCLAAYAASEVQQSMWLRLGLMPLMSPEKELSDGVGAAAAVNLLHMILSLEEDPQGT